MTPTSGSELSTLAGQLSRVIQEINAGLSKKARKIRQNHPNEGYVEAAGGSRRKGIRLAIDSGAAPLPQQRDRPLASCARTGT